MSTAGSQAKRPDAVDKLVGNRVRARRRELELSQESLGKRLGVTFQQIQKYERGVNRVSAGRLVELAAALDTTVAALLEGAEVLNEIQHRYRKSRSAETEAMLVEVVIAYLAVDNPVYRKGVLDYLKRVTKAAKSGFLSQ